MPLIASPRNKIQTGQGLRFFWYAVWTIHLFSVTSGLPPQGSPAPTIASGRTALPADLLYQNSTKRYSVDALGADLYLDTPGRVRLTGSPTIRLFATWQINWAHNFSSSLLPSRLHPMLASGACSCSVTATHGLLPKISDRFKLQPLAKHMFTLERQSTTFLPPLPMTPANPYDFPQKPLTQINPTGISPSQFHSLSGPWRATSIWKLWIDSDANTNCPGLPCTRTLLHRGKQLSSVQLLCVCPAWLADRGCSQGYASSRPPARNSWTLLALSSLSPQLTWIPLFCATPIHDWPRLEESSPAVRCPAAAQLVRCYAPDCLDRLEVSSPDVLRLVAPDGQATDTYSPVARLSWQVLWQSLPLARPGLKVSSPQMAQWPTSLFAVHRRLRLCSSLHSASQYIWLI